MSKDKDNSSKKTGTKPVASVAFPRQEQEELTISCTALRKATGERFHDPDNPLSWFGFNPWLQYVLKKRQFVARDELAKFAEKASKKTIVGYIVIPVLAEDDDTVKHLRRLAPRKPRNIVPQPNPNR